MKRLIPFFLLSISVLSLSVGTWLAISPMMEKTQILEHQKALLESIEQGDGIISLDKDTLKSLADFYDTPGGSDVVSIIPITAAEPDAVESGQSSQAAETPDGSIAGIGVLTIDRIDLKIPVTDGVSEEQLKVAAGWVSQTAPIGNTGNAVIAGHRSYTFGQHFNRLGELVTGDLIQYQPKGGERMTFLVDEILETEPGDAVAFEQPDDIQRLTLYTCTPVQTATRRLLVRAFRIA